MTTTRVIALVAAIASVLGLILLAGGDDDPSGSETRAPSGRRSAPESERAPTVSANGQTQAGTTGGEGRRVRTLGRIDSRARSLAPTRRCGPVTRTAPESQPGRVPPIPSLRAALREDVVVVQYRFRALPTRCLPKYMIITVNSVDDLTNVSTVNSRGGGTVPAEQAARVRVKAPRYGPPPFEARATAITDRGVRAPTTTVPVQ
jgi:hypothetical protein